MKKGITLIALIITIIVLLILAGVSIALIMGDNGILTKANLSKEKTNRNNLLEKIKIDILNKEAEKNGNKLSEDELITILESYGTISDNNDSILNETFTSYEGNISLNVSEIYNGELYQILPCTVVIQEYTISFTPYENETWYDWATDPNDNNDTGPITAFGDLTLKELIIDVHDNGEFPEIHGFKLYNDGSILQGSLFSVTSGESQDWDSIIVPGSTYQAYIFAM